MADILVTGTDTGIGKTVVAAALVLGLRDRGVRAVGFKPVETGLGDESASDVAILAAASAADEPLAEPLLQLGEPLAPAVAADRAAKSLDTAQVEARLQALRAAGYSVVVEGAGGILVPLAWGYTALDLAERMGLEAVIVGRAGLGTLNHVTLTFEALRSRGVTVRGIVLNGRGEPPQLAEATNPAALARLVPDVPIVVIPRHATNDPLEAARRSVESLGPLLDVS